ncbi:MAG: TIGR03617 family F420-dependent LLM class oxidoreductase [Pseudomonadota bacterium]|nr:TIGR03617 family F420-dependent LLM class oxidoreductase [Pseudomonadota bacterium]
MRIMTTIDQSNLESSRKASELAENQGYDGICTLENRHDPFLPLAAASIATSNLELSTGVAIAFLRSPMSCAHISWDLNTASQGRFVLGIGPQIKAHNEKRFSVPWSAPVPRMREYVNSLRDIWKCWKNRSSLDFRGKHYTFTLMPPNFVPENNEFRLPPITIAAVGQSMLRLAGEVADGVRLHPFCTKKYIQNHVMPNIKIGFVRSNKRREHFEISGGSFLATGPTNDIVAERTEWVRYRIGFYGSTPAYWPVLESAGFPDLGKKLNIMTKEGKWDKLAAAVPDDLLHACTIIGRHQEIKQLIADYYGGLSDTLLASQSYEQPSDLPPDLIAELREIETPFKNFSTSENE